MNLRPVGKDDFLEAVDFIRAREHRCITLASNLSVGGKPAFPGNGVRSFVRISRSAFSGIEGIFLVTAQGIALHCVNEGLDLFPYADLIARWLSKQRVHSVIGEYDGTVFLESLVSDRPSRTVDYRLMLFDPSSPPASATEGAVITRCAVADAERLFSLQEGYEREEVLAENDAFDREGSLKAFKINLEKQYIFRAELDGSVAAKAGTNALGLGWAQLGGVYTIPSMRGRGLARTLVRHIAEDRKAAGYRTALFVKLVNKPAEKAYISAGFIPDVKFRISYT